MRTGFSVLRAASAIAVALFALSALGDEKVVGQTSGGYRFSDIVVTTPEHPESGEPDPSHARVKFYLSWASEAFPGERACTWRVYDRMGMLIGESTKTVMALQSEYESPVYNDVAVAGTPSTAQIACTPVRLDDPNGHLRVADVRISEKTQLASATLAVVFSGEWEGAGDPTPQSCTARVFGRSGGLIHEESRNVVTAEPSTTVSLQLEEAPDPLPEDPQRATVTCRSLH